MLVAVCVAFSLLGKPLMISGWVPYWRCARAIKTAQDHSNLFCQMSAFSYEVGAQGVLRDPLKKNTQLWESLRTTCSEKDILFVPTIFWNSTNRMTIVFSSKELTKKHRKAILELVLTNNYAGININYERIGAQNRTPFVTFLEKLSKDLHRNKRVLHLTIPGRTGDSTVAFVKHPKRSPFSCTSLKKMVLDCIRPKKPENDRSHYKKIVARCCDQVHVMGYDEWGSPHRSNPEHLENEYYLSHASNQWVEQILTYALSYIPRHKLVLGIPTYGLEVAITHTPEKILFQKRRHLNFYSAAELSKTVQQEPKRTAGGELSFTYHTGTEKRYVCYLSAQSIQEKINLAKKYQIKGINLFTINGHEDPELWTILETDAPCTALTANQS